MRIEMFVHGLARIERNYKNPSVQLREIRVQEITSILILLAGPQIGCLGPVLQDDEGIGSALDHADL